MANNAILHNKIWFSTILPPLRLLLLRTYLYHSIYKKNYRCAASLLTRETDRFAGIKKRLRRANRRGSRRTFGKLQESPANLQFRSQSVRRFQDLSRGPFSRTLVREAGCAAFRCGDFYIGRMSDVLFMHRLGAFVSRLAGAVIETGDGLCGALLLSLRHLSTSSEPRRRGSGVRCGGTLPLTAMATGI